MAGKQCRCCGKGKFELVQLDYTETIREKIFIHNKIWVNKCNLCEELVFPAMTVSYMQKTILQLN